MAYNENLEQIYLANPAYSLVSGDLLYIARSPYATGVDNYAITIDDLINTTNLQYTAGQINTIQNITTTSSPTFAGLTLTSFSGVVTASAGVFSYSATLPLSLGGTNAALTASNGGVVWSNASQFQILSGTATANQVLLSGSTATPAWSTATYPPTTTINQLLYSSSANVIGGITASDNGVMISGTAGVPSWLAAGTTGQVLSATTSNPPSWETLSSIAVTSVQGTAPIQANGVSGTPESGAVTVSVTNATTSNVGVASFNATNFSVSSGAVTSQNITVTASTGLSGGGSFTLGGSTTVSLSTPVSLANGGTNANLTASNGGIFYSTASAAAILSGTATAQQLLLSGSSTTPQWSTTTYPLTNAINTLLYASSANVMSALATATTAVLTTSSGIPTWASELSLALGGTNANLTASNGGIFYSTASAGAILAGTSTAQQLLLSGASTTPQWSTTTYPLTNVVNTLLYASSANVMAALATANSGVLITSSGGAPSIGTTLPTGVQTNITELGTITTGTWTGSLIALAYGGTNANLTASNGGVVWSNSTQLQILAGTATAKQVLLSGATATPAWSTATYPSTTTINQLLYSSGANTITGLATATTAVLTTSASVPTWASELSLALGGTNANLTASNGGIFYSTASAGAILAGTATAQQLLLSGTSTTPQWSTTTYPLTNVINTLLYASAANVMSALATANSGVLITSSGGVPSIATTLPTGVQTNITELGTITTGVWNGTAINLSSYASGTLQAAQFPALTGDVTNTAGSLATTISANVVSNAKFRQSGATTLVGNPTGSTANVEDITLGTGLTFSGTTINSLSGFINDTYAYTCYGGL